MSVPFSPGALRPASPTGLAVEPERPDPRPILSVDFDGVLHSYESGWKGAAVIPDRPTPGAIVWLADAVKLFRVAIFSSRSHQPGGIEAMRRWLLHYALEHFQDEAKVSWVGQVEFPLEKPPALVTIDDRALTFDGCWAHFDPVKLLEFKPWNRP